MKKLLAVLLCLVMVLSLFAACNQQTPPTTTTEGKPDTPTAAPTQGTTAAPTTTEAEPITLTIALTQRATVEDHNTNSYTLWLEEQTGYNLEFMLLQSSAADYKAQIATMLLDNDKSALPDIFWYVNPGDALYEQYGDDGYFMDLTPYFEDREKSGAWWDSVEWLPDDVLDYALGTMYSDSGKIYAFPTIMYDDQDVIKYQLQINQEWLKRLNLPMPTDLDSLYNTLIAFRDLDPNGNGIKDEIPLMGATSNSSDDVVSWIVNMFTWVDDDRWFNLDENDNCYLPYMTDKYREALKFCNKLVAEGLMPESVFTAKTTEIKGLMNPADGITSVGVLVGHPTLVYDGVNEAIFEYAAIPQWSPVVIGNQAVHRRCFISTSCEHPDAAWNLLMTMASQEGGIRMRYGVKDVHWTEPAAGELDATGAQATVKLLAPDFWGSIQNEQWGIICCSTPRPGGVSMSSFENLDAVTVYNNATNTYDDLNYTEEQSELIADIKTNCATYIKAARASFICGTGDLNNPSDDAQWAAYLAELEKMGVSTWIKQAEQIYHATKK